MTCGSRSRRVSLGHVRTPRNPKTKQLRSTKRTKYTLEERFSNKLAVEAEGNKMKNTDPIETQTPRPLSLPRVLQNDAPVLRRRAALAWSAPLLGPPEDQLDGTLLWNSWRKDVSRIYNEITQNNRTY